MVELNQEEYMLFTERDFNVITGYNLYEELQDRGIDKPSTYVIIYASNLIMNYIRESTSKNVYKVYDKLDQTKYKIYVGISRERCLKLTNEQIKALKLACIYQLEYILDNGSPERMLGVAISGKGYKIDKKSLKEFEISSISQGLLASVGLLYSGLGGNVNVWL